MKTILVTGATNGIGLEASVVLAKQGHRVVLVGRDRRKTDDAVATVKQRSGSQAVDGLACDFSSQKQIRQLAADYRAKYDRLDVLVNNAGLVTDKRTTTEDGLETTFAVNHLGYFLLTNLLLDLVIKSAPARIVVVSSTGHYRGTLDLDDPGYERGGWSVMNAYRRSKLANVLFTRHLARQLKDKGVTVNALHPGGVATGIWSKAPWFARPVLAVVKALFLITPEEGGSYIVRLATGEDVASTTGQYFDMAKPQEPSTLAQDDALGERLWALSAKLTGVSGQ